MDKTMKYCEKCGAGMPDDVLICPECCYSKDSEEKRSARAFLIESAKREDMIDFLNSVGVWITKRQSSSATGVQSANQVLMAVLVSCWERTASTSFHIS